MTRERRPLELEQAEGRERSRPSGPAYGRVTHAAPRQGSRPTTSSDARRPAPRSAREACPCAVRSALHARAWTSSRSPTARSPTSFLPFRRIFVASSTTSVTVPRLVYARAHRLPCSTWTPSDAAPKLDRVPLSTTVTFGRHSAPVVAGLPAGRRLAGRFRLALTGRRCSDRARHSKSDRSEPNCQ